MTDYRPIDCGLHSEYELAIMQGRRLTLRWREAGGEARRETLLPLDLVTRDGAEYLLAEDSDGRRLEIRLDHID